jgi:hypothetical protein
MTLRSIRSLFIALLMLAPFTAQAQDTASKGTIKEMGYGKFLLSEAGGLDRLYLVGKKDTSYEPMEWRPYAGDQVSVSFFQKKDKLVASQVKLEKLGPNSIDPKKMVSPMHVVVRETGKTGIIGTPKGFNRTVKFSNARKKTTYDPVGWVPAPGEEIEVEFTTVPSRFAFDITYQLGAVKRIAK